ncbi:MAG: hypothetical protein ACK46L_13235 [Synechococcaceae cyanobacterium]|jgi:hypothetical protein
MKFQTRIKKRSSLAALELGFARLLDFSGSLTTYTYEQHPGSADAAAIASDWMHVGGDIRMACNKEDQLIASSGR